MTLHDLKVAGGHLIAVCKRCLHRAEVKPDDVISTLGWDFPCSACARCCVARAAKRAASPTCTRLGHSYLFSERRKRSIACRAISAGSVAPCSARPTMMLASIRRAALAASSLSAVGQQRPAPSRAWRITSRTLAENHAAGRPASGGPSPHAFRRISGARLARALEG
jgi:hypothetical protein